MKLYNLKDHNEQVSFAQAIKQGLGKQQGLFSRWICRNLN